MLNLSRENDKIIIIKKLIEAEDEMKKLNSKFISTALISGICLFMFTGCESLDYTEEQEDIIANYAANLVLKHDVHYKYNFVTHDDTAMAEPVTEDILSPEETTTPDTENGNSSAGGSSVDGNEILSDTNSITQALHVPEGITAEYLDYDITDRYPSENSGDGLFVMKSVDNHKLLVITFKITNTTDHDIAVNMMESNSKYKGIVNNAKKYNAQLTLLLDALNTYEGTIPAGGGQNLVLIYQTQIDSKDEIHSLSVAISNSADGEAVIKLK